MVVGLVFNGLDSSELNGSSTVSTLSPQGQGAVKDSCPGPRNGGGPSLQDLFPQNFKQGTLGFVTMQKGEAMHAAPSAERVQGWGWERELLPLWWQQKVPIVPCSPSLGLTIE